MTDDRTQSQKDAAKRAEFRREQQARSDELDALHRRNHPEMYFESGRPRPNACSVTEEDEQP